MQCSAHWKTTVRARWEAPIYQAGAHLPSPTLCTSTSCPCQLKNQQPSSPGIELHTKLPLSLLQHQQLALQPGHHPPLANAQVDQVHITDQSHHHMYSEIQKRGQAENRDGINGCYIWCLPMPTMLHLLHCYIDTFPHLVHLVHCYIWC